MYFIAGDKVYSTFFNEKKNIYPEVKVVRTAADQLAIKVLDTGVATKPHYRQVATQTELFAKFGAIAAPEAQPDVAATPNESEKPEKPEKTTKTKA